MELVCIVCPNGCRLDAEFAENKLTVKGAKCKRGEKFAETELTNPTRSVTSSVKTAIEDFPVVSVRTDGEIPKSKIFELMKLLSECVLTKAVPIGTIIMEKVVGTDVNIITTTDMEA